MNEGRDAYALSCIHPFYGMRMCIRICVIAERREKMNTVFIKKAGLAALLAGMLLFSSGTAGPARAAAEMETSRSGMSASSENENPGKDEAAENVEEAAGKEENTDDVAGEKETDMENENPGEDEETEEPVKRGDAETEGSKEEEKPEAEDPAEEEEPEAEGPAEEEEPEAEDPAEGEEPEAEGSAEGKEPEDSEEEDDAETKDPVEGEGTEDENAEAGLELSAAAVYNTAKAGGTLLYEIKAVNTGDTDLKNLVFSAGFGEEALQGAWDGENGIKKENRLFFDHMEAGIEKIMYFRVALPEDRTDPVNLKLHVRAEYMQTEALEKEISLHTDIVPLKADFQVTKTADRTAAAAGEKIRFRICIRNTGERTLHSVLTTERLLSEGMQVRFLEKEGVQLDHTKTKALIPEIEPGHAVGLESEVVLPENVSDGRLVNEVTVTTAETGEKTSVSQAEVQILAASVTAEPDAGPDSSESCQEVTPPKTGDSSHAGKYEKIFAVSGLCGGFFAVKIIMGYKKRKRTAQTND